MPNLVHRTGPVGGALVDLADVARLDAQAARFRVASKASGTRRAYRVDLVDFEAWCNDYELRSLPAEPSTVARYIADLAARARAVSTINGRVSAIAYAHKHAGHPDPTADPAVRDVMAGIRRSDGRRTRKAAPLTADLAAKVVRKIPARDPRGLRDRALILLCFGAALRRSELVALDVADIEWRAKGLVVHVRRSKTDQEGAGRTVAVLDGKLKVPAALRAWLDAAGITSGPLFLAFDRGALTDRRLSDGQFGRAFKVRCAAAGLDARLFSGHSCRRGFATSADEAGADLKATSDQLGHVRLDTTRGYMGAEDKFRRNAGKGFM